MICSKCLAPNGETWKPPHIVQKEVKADLAKKMQYNPKQFCNLKTYLIDIFPHDMYRFCTQEPLGQANIVKGFVKIFIWISLTCNMEFVKIVLYISCHKKSQGMQAWSNDLSKSIYGFL